MRRKDLYYHCALLCLCFDGVLFCMFPLSMFWIVVGIGVMLAGCVVFGLTFLKENQYEESEKALERNKDEAIAATCFMVTLLFQAIGKACRF